MPEHAFGCARARSRRLAVGEIALHALEAGGAGAPPLCFLHGGAAHAHWFDAVIPAFVARHHVVSLDQRGHGESAWASPPAYATQDFAADLLGVMEVLGWDRMALVGHSMGGHNAMAFAAWHPERVTALVVVDSRPALPEDRVERMHARGQRPPRLHASADDALRSFRLLPPETIADPTLLRHLGQAGLVQVNGGWKYRFDPACYAARRPVDAWPLLSRISAPTLIVRGEHSPIMTREIAESMGAAIPDAAVVEIPGTYHHLVLDAPERFTAALADFLAVVR